MSAQGYVRATRDVDILVTIPPRGGAGAAREAWSLCEDSPGRFFRRRLSGVLKGSIDEIPFDILPQIVPLEADRVQSIQIGTLLLRVVDFDTLARLKLTAGSPKDLWDLAILVNMEPERRERTLQLAATIPLLAEQVRSYIDDPRARREAVERARDVRGPARPRKKKHRWAADFRLLFLFALSQSLRVPRLAADVVPPSISRGSVLASVLRGRALEGIQARGTRGEF